MQNFVRKTKCIVGYMEVANIEVCPESLRAMLIY